MKMGDTGGGSQLWLTSAINDDDVTKALTLCFSLRKTLTTRKIGVIVSKEVSPTFRKLLFHTFDTLLHLEEVDNSVGLRMEEFVKLYALTLKSFEKIVYLKPTLLAIKNSDEIFDKNKHDFDKNCDWTECENVSVLLVKPSLETFGLLMKGLQTRNGNVSGQLNSYLNIWNETQTGGQGIIRVLQGKYNCLMVPQHGFLVGNKTDISIIDLGDIPVKVDDEEKFGLLENLILREREKIFLEAVQPLLESNQPVDSLMLTGGPTSPHGHLLHKNDSIAIVGMSCRYPSANNLDEFWQLLLNGEDGLGTPPDFRWLREHSTVNPPGCKKTNAGFLKEPVDEFDSKFFGISPKEMELLDPQHRLLHELVWEALEDAAVTPSSIEGTNGGVFIGSWLADYKDIVTLSGGSDIFRKYMGNSIGAGAARISHLLGLIGPSIATESGCSSAMVALHLACKSLQRGETNLALACGVNLLLRPYTDEMSMVVSPDGRCKTFDAKADGYARAEGCGVLVLKRFSDAVRDGDKIWALIRGSGMTQEGVSKSLGTPTVHCESLAMSLALQDARVLPQQVSYVETHGTGTAVGDPLEVAAIAKAYHSKWRKEPLLIGSVKTNVGHTESCSGITGIMKVVLAMKQEIIPPHRNLETLNPAINLDAVPAKIPLKTVFWPKIEGESRYAGVSSFGITGTDAHLILEETPLLPLCPLIMKDFKRPLHIMKISAKTSEALELLIEKYTNYFKQGGNETSFSELAYTANIGRADFNHKAVIIASSSKEAIKRIEENKTMRGVAVGEGEMGKVCFLFTGQGSQYPGMAKQLYETSPVFRMHFEYCNHILKESYNIDITPVLWSTDAKIKNLSRTIYSQTSIFCVEYALTKLWESWGIKPDFVLGHSLGEFAAAVCCGILSVEDGIKLVAERSRLIEQLPRGKMLVIKAAKEKVDPLLNKFARNEKNRLLDYAALNSSEQTVVAGDSELIDEFAEFCNKAKLKSIVLASSHAFHSKHMDPILDEYRNIASSVRRMEGDGCKYISGMRGRLIDAHEIDENYWVHHTSDKVMFMDASNKAVDLGCHIFIEIGPQPVLSALTMMNNDTQLLCLPSLKRNENDWDTLLDTLGKLYLQGVEIDWKGFDQFYERNKARLPHYPFIGRKFWTEVRATSSTSIHPLLGNIIPSPLSAKMFQSTFNLKSLEYVKDHCIGDKPIFPGAGYLEMCLAAGHASLHNSNESLLPPPSFPMKLENLSIYAPLQLHDSTSSQIQTVVESAENQSTVKIFRYLESESGSGSNKWISHAEASFSIALTADHATIPLPFDLEMFRETLKTPVNHKLSKEIYQNYFADGFNFGETFKSLEKIWKDEDDDKNKSLIAKIKLPPPEENNKYIIHPVVLDAMLQGIAMLCHASILRKKLCIPIKIGKFLWLSGTDSRELYVQVLNSAAEGTAYLIDGKGMLLAVIWSVDMVETTVKAIESVLEQQKNAMPEMWEEVWKSEVGSAQHDVDLEKACERFYTSEFANQVESKYNQLSSYETETLDLIEQLSYLNILRGIYECGWKPEMELVLETDAVLMELNIEKSLKPYFNFILNVLEKEGILKIIKQSKREPTTWKVVRVPPSLEEVKTTIISPIFTDFVQRCQSALLISKFGENLAAILQGKLSSRSILFPQEENRNKTYPSLPEFLEEYAGMFKQTESCRAIFCKRLSHIRDKMKGEHFILRILEVGGGDSGSYTSHFLKSLEEEGIEFEYTITNPSDLFFSAHEKTFEKHGSQMKFRKLNIDEDPIEQGFIPESFDYIFMADVLQVTEDLPKSLRNINMLMKPFGKIDIMQGIGGHVRFLSGALYGDRGVQTFDVPSIHSTPSTIQICNMVLNEAEFDVEGIFPTVNNHFTYMCATKKAGDPLPLQLNLSTILTTSKTWLVFHEPSSPISGFLINKICGVTKRKIISVTSGSQFQDDLDKFTIRKSTEEDFVQILELIKKRGLELEGILYCWALDKKLVSQEEILQPYFNLAKSILSTGLSASSKLIALINGCVVQLEGNDLSYFHTSTLWGFTKSLKDENVDLDCRCIQLIRDIHDEKQMQNVFLEIWRHRKESMVALDGNSCYMPKLQPLKMSKILRNKSLSIPKGRDRFKLLIPATKAMSDLEFGSLETNVLKDDEVEVQIIATALNFRDVLSVLKPSDEFTNINSVGCDFAGVVKRKGNGVTRWEVGDRVFGCNIHFTEMRTHITLEEDLILPLPPHLNFCEGATITIPYVTSLQSLKEIAKIQKKDTVLIHTASGGVGLSAIEICKHAGCTIIVTAGSSRKRNYLKSLGIKHIFHSRNKNYADQTLELTNGRGVDVVLNSLTSPGFKEATLKACAKGARFVEMSKLNIWNEEQVKQLRPDVQYTIIDVTQNSKDEWIRVFNGLAELQRENVVKPIPYVRFDALNVGDALEYMQQAKHIGKIVCRMPEMRNEGGEMKVFTPLFNETSTYLITGGLGGIGFVVCQWMVRNGAKHVLLAGRSPPDDDIQKRIYDMNFQGANVIPAQLDVGNFEQCQHFIEVRIKEMNLPPLKGIMHCAASLADGLVINQHWEQFTQPFNAKINGTLNLHELAKSLNLEHFVLFSSMTSLFGYIGQSNYSAGNGYQDALAHYRQSIGLPSTSINWGPWSEVGIATDAELPGFKGLSNLQGISGLEYLLRRGQRTQTAIFSVTSFQTLSNFISNLASYFDERVWNGNVSTTEKSTSTIESSTFWKQYNTCLELAEKVGVLKTHLKSSLKNMLKLDESDAIGDDMDMQELGVDSLMFVEIRNLLQTLLGSKLILTASSIRDCNTVTQISNRIVGLVEGTHKVGIQDKPTKKEVNELMREDCKLAEHIRVQPSQTIESVTEIRRVLLTGSTGTFGPYVLKLLTNLPQITQVVCLMRKVKQGTPEGRLERILGNLDLLVEVDMRKIKCVTGNMAEFHLGLESKIWEELSGSMDAVMNCAASVQHIEYYRKREKNQNDMRAVNVEGVVNVLEFACENKLKHVFHASTIFAVASLDDETGHVSENWPKVGDFDDITTLGYQATLSPNLLVM